MHLTPPLKLNYFCHYTYSNQFKFCIKDLIALVFITKGFMKYEKNDPVPIYMWNLNQIRVSHNTKYFSAYN